jgi:hypothetical protein
MRLARIRAVKDGLVIVLVSAPVNFDLNNRKQVFLRGKQYTLDVPLEEAEAELDAALRDEDVIEADALNGRR